MQKIIYLSVTVLALALFNILSSSFLTPKIYDLSVYIEGDNANLARVADLTIDYNRDDMELISTTAGGFFDNASVIKKVGWQSNRLLLLSTSTDISKPVLKLKFRSKNRPKNVKMSSESAVYLTTIGITSLPSSGIEYRVKYE